MDYFLSTISLAILALAVVEIYRLRKQKRETGIAPEGLTPEGSIIFLGILLLIVVYGAFVGLQVWVTAIFGPIIAVGLVYRIWRLISTK